MQPPIRVEATQVARAIRPAGGVVVVDAEGGRRSLRVAVVADGQEPAGNDDLAGRAVRDGVAGVIADRHDHVRHGVADRERPGPATRRDARFTVAGDEELARQAGLGGAQTVDQHRADGGVPGEALGIGPCGEIAFEPNDAEIGVRRIAREDGPGHDRDAVEHRRALLAEPGADPLDTTVAKVERQDRRSVQEAGEQRRDDPTERRRVDEREPIAGSDAEARGVAADVVQDVPMGVEDALRRARRAGGVEQRRRCVGVDGRGLGPGRWWRALEQRADVDDRTITGDAPAEMRRRGGHEHRGRVGVIEPSPHGGLGVRGIHRDERGAGPEHAHRRRREACALVHQDGDRTPADGCLRIPGADGPEDGRGDRRGLHIQTGVGCAGPAGHDRRSIREPANDLSEPVRDRSLDDRGRPRDRVVVPTEPSSIVGDLDDFARLAHARGMIDATLDETEGGSP